MGIVSYLKRQFEAAAFAEAGEFDTAREMAGEGLAKELVNEAEPTARELSWAAVAFAEAGEFDTAREMLGEDSPDRDQHQEIYTEEAVASPAR